MVEADLNNPTRYIIKNPSGTYTIRKFFDGKNHSFGTFLNLEDAMKVRDVLESVNFGLTPKPMKYISYSKTSTNPWRVMKIRDGVRIFDCCYSTLEIAQKERDLLMENDWDIEGLQTGDLSEYELRYGARFKTAQQSHYKPQSDYYKPFFKGQKNCNAYVREGSAE